MTVILLLAMASTARAQWITQSFGLKAGWNAIFTHIDAAHTTLDDLIGSDPDHPVLEVWLWQPLPATMQFVTTPQQPGGAGTSWVNWVRGNTASATFQRIVANAAYLVRVRSDVPNYTWNIKGKPVPPRYQWTSTGLNFIGFPTLATNATDFETFFTPAPELRRVAEAFQYPGGDLGPNNPSRVFALRTTPVKRGEAFWVRSSGVFNRYFGPFEADLQNPGGVSFREDLSQYRIRLRNLQAAPLTVTLRLVNSEAPPAGQTPIVQAPPLLVRGELNTTNLTYAYADLSGGPQAWTLTAQGQLGSEVELVIGVNRSQMTGAAGQLYGGILRFTDSLDVSQVDVPVSAVVGSTAGLWVGNASVRHVQHYLKAYQKDGDGKPVVSTNGHYVATGTNVTLGATAREFPLRLILHKNSGTNVVLLQRVYFGLGQQTNPVVATRESALHAAHLSSARRISSVHFPWSEANTPWILSGELQQGGSLAGSVELAHDSQSSNPFLHTYHPDHDNLDASFHQVMPTGFESFRVQRQISLAVTPPANDFASLTGGSQSLAGVYSETIAFFGRGTESRQFEVRGNFVLNRISHIETLTIP